MAKSQKRSSKEPKKETDAEKKGKKLSGPKYLRQTEAPLLGKTLAQKLGQK